MKYILIALALFFFAGTATAQETPVQEPAPIPSWFRLDTDALSLQLWAGATHTIGPVDIATNIYADSGTFAEFDIGPTFSFGPVILTTVGGLGFDWAEQRAVTVVPQIITIVDPDYIYFESWAQVFWNSVFTSGADNDFYTRDFLLGKVSDDFHIGAQAEATIGLNNDRNELVSLPVGARINLVYGQGNLLGLFLGYETQGSARQIDTGEVDAAGEPVFVERGLVGRFTFVHTWSG